MSDVLRRLFVVLALSTILWPTGAVFAQDVSAAKPRFVVKPVDAIGYRQNWTGRFPDANPPTTWERTPINSVVKGLLYSSAKPADATGAGGKPVDPRFGVIGKWLVIGPFRKDGADEGPYGKAFLDDVFAPEDPQHVPAAGLKVPGTPAEREWTEATVTIPLYDKISEYGDEPLWVTLPVDKEHGGFVSYAHAWLYSPQGGRVRFVFDHHQGCKLWLNGKEIYRNLEGVVAYPGYEQHSQAVMRMQEPVSAIVVAELKPGWNRLLAKVATWNAVKWALFDLRVTDVDLKYREKNILWKTELPGRSLANPIVVGDRIFVLAEPDELLCLDKKTGKVLWTRRNGFWEAIPDAEKATNATLRDEVAPLAKKLDAATDPGEKLALRRQIQELLVKVDKDKYDWTINRTEEHFHGHYRITGNCGTTPSSDGKYVYVFPNGLGVAACYDLDGNRRWIERLDIMLREPGDKTWPQHYPTPATTLAEGKFLVNMKGLVALDAATGRILWRRPEAMGSAAFTVDGVAFVTGGMCGGGGSGDCHIVRVSDGKSLGTYKIYAGDFTTPSWDDKGLMYHAGMRIDFSNAKGDPRGDSLQPVTVPLFTERLGLGPAIVPEGVTPPRGVGGIPGNYGSALVYDGIAYYVTFQGWMYVMDVGATDPKPICHRYFGDVFHIISHANACGITASPALGGKHIYIMGDQGETVVLEPGRELKQVAVNVIESYPERKIKFIPFRETTYPSPIFDGNRLYIRGEKYLYCIAEK